MPRPNIPSTLLTLALCSAAASARADDFLRNGGFDQVGVLGAAVTHVGGTPSDTAAADWSLLQSGNSSFAVTALSASTDPLAGGGGNMLTLFASAEAPTVLFQRFDMPLAPGASASIDVYLGAGTRVEYGFTDAAGRFLEGTGAAAMNGTGQWARFAISTDLLSEGFGLAVTSAVSTVLLDHATVSAVPESSALLLGPVGALLMAWRRRRTAAAV